MIFKSQYCFANISATKASIFMKFKTYIHKIVQNYQMIFRKDPCTHTRTQGVNVGACFVATKRASARLRLVCPLVCTDLYEKSFDNSLLSYKYKSQISLISELSLRRYLQNNTDYFSNLNFQCISTIFIKTHNF